MTMAFPPFQSGNALWFTRSHHHRQPPPAARPVFTATGSFDKAEWMAKYPVAVGGTFTSPRSLPLGGVAPPTLPTEHCVCVAATARMIMVTDYGILCAKSNVAVTKAPLQPCETPVCPGLCSPVRLRLGHPIGCFASLAATGFRELR